ncbi:MAG: type II toxin-antitoxin system VapC family toxin [Kiritimatiellae bacterium]|nr:type II toxin-antitoxin system VapC family toxin [Kiritimatiellia bacterium]
MPMKYLLDTHTWIWMNAFPEEIPRSVAKLVERLGDEDELLLSAISILELCKLVEKGRVRLFEDLEVWVETALDTPRLRVVPVDFRVFYRSTTLPAPFHSDPADQMIVATARLEDATIITRDKLLRNYPHVKTCW